MVERKRSKDGSRDSEKFSQIDAGSPGRSGGNLARDIGTRDDLKRAQEQPAGVTRVTKSDEQEDGDDKKTGG